MGMVFLGKMQVLCHDERKKIIKLQVVACVLGADPKHMTFNCFHRCRKCVKLVGGKRHMVGHDECVQELAFAM